MRGVRLALGVLGVGLAGYGLTRLLALPVDQLPAVALWVAGGIAVHDGLLAPAVVGLGLLGALRLPDWLRSPVLRAAVVLGPLTVVAVPVLGRFGAKADNATLLDRPYLVGYAGLVAIIAAVTAVSALRARRADRAPSAAPST